MTLWMEILVCLLALQSRLRYPSNYWIHRHLWSLADWHHRVKKIICPIFCQTNNLVSQQTFCHSRKHTCRLHGTESSPLLSVSVTSARSPLSEVQQSLIRLWVSYDDMSKCLQTATREMSKPGSFVWAKSEKLKSLVCILTVYVVHLPRLLLFCLPNKFD